jgi:hypothetical protein
MPYRPHDGRLSPAAMIQRVRGFSPEEKHGEKKDKPDNKGEDKG